MILTLPQAIGMFALAIAADILIANILVCILDQLFRSKK
jgi:hypothetical protein